MNEIYYLSKNKKKKHDIIQSAVVIGAQSVSTKYLYMLGSRFNFACDHC